MCVLEQGFSRGGGGGAMGEIAPPPFEYPKNII